MSLSPLPAGVFKALNLYLRYSKCNFRPVKVNTGAVVPLLPKRHSSVGIVTGLRGRRPWNRGSIPEDEVELDSNSKLER
jgi:hypothetical protein